MLDQQLIVGKTYRFTFKSEFERHGYCTGDVKCLHPGNGVFTLQEIASFSDVVIAGGSVFNTFFRPLGISEEEYRSYFSGKPDDVIESDKIAIPIDTKFTDTIITASGEAVQRQIVGRRYEIVESGASRLKKHFIDELSYGKYPIYKLVDVVDPDDVIYVPERAILGVPEVDIDEYQNMTLTIDVGYFRNPEQLDGILHSIREQLVLFGISPLNAYMFSADSRWMNPDEYEACKSIRVPGKLVKIPKTNNDSYIGQWAVVDGTLKQIAATPAKGKTLEDYQIDILKLAVDDNKVVDPHIFLEEMQPIPYGETGCYIQPTFESGHEYLLKTDSFNGECYVKYVEGADWLPGDAISIFKRSTDSAAVSDKRYFEQVVSQDTWKRLELTIDGSSAIDAIARGETVYSLPINWTPTNGKKIESGVEYYQKSGSDYVRISPPVGSDGNAEIFTREEVPTPRNFDYVKANPTEVFYLKSKIDTYYKETEWSSSKELWVLQPFYHLNFGSDKAFSLIGTRFKYSNKVGTLVDTTLNGNNITDIALEESNEVRIANTIVASKYSGRWFEFRCLVKCSPDEKSNGYNSYFEMNSKGEEIPYFDSDIVKLSKFVISDKLEGESVRDCYTFCTFCVTINEPGDSQNHNKFAIAYGRIIGEQGESYKEVHVKDSSLDRNYYALYKEELARNANLVKENAALCEIIDKLNK